MIKAMLEHVRGTGFCAISVEPQYVIWQMIVYITMWVELCDFMCISVVKERQGPVYLFPSWCYH